MAKSRQEIENRVIGIVNEIFRPDFHITADTHFTRDLGCDSLDVLEIIMEFEDEYNIAIPDADAEAIVTVSDAVDYLVNRLDARIDDGKD